MPMHEFVDDVDVLELLVEMKLIQFFFLRKPVLHFFISLCYNTDQTRINVDTIR